MELKELLKTNNPNDTIYCLRLLLKQMKKVDYCLTNYLVEDIYRPNEISLSEIMAKIAETANMCEYILKKIQFEDLTYYRTFMQDTVEQAKEIHDSWNAFLCIREKLEEYKDVLKFDDIYLNKGFGFYHCNFSFLEILYRKKLDDHSTLTFSILTVTTHDGREFQIKKTREFYEKSGLPLDDFRKNIDTTFTFENLNEAVEKIKYLCLDFKEQEGKNE